MKKRILSFILMISMLSSLFMAFPLVANAAGGTKDEAQVSIKSVYCYYADNKVTAEVDFKSVGEDCTIILAVYNEGKFIDVKREVLSIDELKKNVVISDVYENCIGYDAKVFCWGRADELIPLATPVSVKITEYETEVVRRLRAVSEEIALYTDKSKPELYTIFTNTERYMLKTIKECIDNAIKDHKDELTADFVKNTYEDEINEVHGIYDQLQDEGKDDAFIGKLGANFTTHNLIWLADTFDIDLEKFGIDPSDYI